MTKQLSAIAVAACTALSTIGMPTALAKQQCSSAATPSHTHGFWSWRLIDERKCWYEGKPGLSKSLLEWPREVSAQPASGEGNVSPAPEKPRSPLDSQAWAPSSQARAPTDPGAPTDTDTFETKWSDRATVETRAVSKEAASVTPVAPEDGDGPA